MRLLFLMLLYLLPSLAFATKRLAVLEFRGVGVEDAVLTILSDSVRKGVLDVTQEQKVDGDELLVMTRENMMDMLGQMGKSAADCQGECEVELARNIGADYVISGEAAKLGELYVLTVKLHETDRGVLLATEILKTKDMEEFIDGAQEKAIIISKKGLKVQQSQPQKNNTQTTVQTTQAEVKSKRTNEQSIEVRNHTFVLIPAGTFQMGCTTGDSDCSELERPVHDVELTRSFYMSQTEVTQGLWKEVMGSNPSRFSSCGDDCPVENVSWNDAAEFSNKLSEMEGLELCYEISPLNIHFKGLDCEGYRLPTEAEWEYAARGGEKYIYAGSNTLDEIGWYKENASTKTHPVCEKKENGYGLCDMSGNVYEWVWDWKGDYSSLKKTDPKGPDFGTERVYRGGAWFFNPLFARVSIRYEFDSSRRSDVLGFRLCRSSVKP